MTDTEKNGAAELNIRIKAPMSAWLKDKATWLVLAVVAYAGGDMILKGRVVYTTEETKDAATEVKEIAQEQTLPTAKEIKHELSNGLADRIANRVNAKMSPRIDAMEKRIDELTRFLIGDANREGNGASVKPAAGTTAATNGNGQ